jgi:cholesterol transport system auxiliary component
MRNGNRNAPDCNAHASALPTTQLADQRGGRMLRVVLPMVAAYLAGCSALPTAPQIEQPVLHVLDARPAIARAEASRDLVLEVSVPRAAPGFDTTALLYVQKPFVLDAFATHRWADAPAHMIGPPLTQALTQTGYFRAVVTAPAGVPVDLRLDTELVRLQHSFMTKPSRIELSLRFRLLDLRARRVVATRFVDVEIDAASDNPDGGVVAANTALAGALTQAAAFAVAAAADVPAVAAGKR